MAEICPLSACRSFDPVVPIISHYLPVDMPTAITTRTRMRLNLNLNLNVNARLRQTRLPLASSSSPSLRTSDVGAGTWAWGNKLIWDYSEDDDAKLQKAFDILVDGGVSFFDTGDSYGTGKLEGRAEQLLGDFASNYRPSPSPFAPSPDNLVIATKLAVYPWRITTKQMKNALAASQKRAQGRIRVVQLHWSAGNYQPLQERCMWDSICTMYEEGLVEAVGVSNFGPKQLKKVHDYCAAREVPIAVAQTQYSLVSCQQEMEDHRALCADLGIQMIAYSPLGLGLLTSKYASLVDDDDNDNVDAALPTSAVRSSLLKGALPGARTLLRTLRSVARDNGRTESEIAVSWCVGKGTLPIVGVKNVDQAQSVVRCNDGFRLSAKDMSRLDEASKTFEQPIARNVFLTK